jgi:malonyl-CoA/methylmalonyl-CoA synthetase
VVSNKNQIGMIEIKGPNVFKGYLNKLDQTKEAFTKDGYFITGDIGYFDDDGYLYISGRNKDLIISGGYNIYPKEIEDVINENENVIESAVFGIPDNDLGEIPVVAIVMYQKDNKLENIKSYLEKNLVRYKIPKDYFILDELPKNIMGKVQKNILKKNIIKIK